MTLLKIDDKALIPPPPVIPSPPVTAAPAESGEPGPEQIWRDPAARLLARLKTKIEGLTTAEFKSRLASYGENNASEVKAAPLWRQFLVRFENPLMIILLMAAGVSALTGGVAGFVVIVVIVMLSVVFDFVQDVRAQNAVASLRASVSVQATVRRDGKAVSVPISQLVPGDIVELVAGDLVPADSRLLESRDLYVNQALLTGEPYPAEKWVGDSASGAENPARRLQRRIRRHLRHQRNRDHPDLPDRQQVGARPTRDQPGREAAVHRLRARNSSFQHADHALHRGADRVRAGREPLVRAADAGIDHVRCRPRCRPDPGTAADDRHGHARPLGHANGQTKGDREAFVRDPRRRRHECSVHRQDGHADGSQDQAATRDRRQRRRERERLFLCLCRTASSRRA